MHIYPKRAPLEGLEIEIFKLVSYSATPEQWKEWLRVPLEHAAARGNLDLFNKLLGAGADGSARWRGCRNRTLLDAAAVGGNEEVVSGLLRVGAQPDVKVVSCFSNRSALYTAVMLGHKAVARLLMVAGADVNFEDPIDKRPILNEALRGGHEQLVTDMLIGGANPNCQTGVSGAFPLHIAAGGGVCGIVSTLLLRGADKDALDNDERTPLMWASDHGHPSVVNTLLTAGADGSIKGIDGYSALDCAASRGHGAVIEAFVGHGADVNAQDDIGFTALHSAAIHDRAAAVDALIKAGADVELKMDFGFTSLATAAYNGSCNAFLALLQHGAKVDVQDYSADTPLHEACFGRTTGLAAVVDLLLRWGADETALNDAGQSPVEMLDVENDEDVDKPSTQEEIDRARLLLSRAPADRAWRRRGWLVMLRSRGSEAKIASRDVVSETGGGSSSSACDRQAEGSKMARTQSNGADIGLHGKVGLGSGTGGDDESEGWSAVVELLLGLGLEGVFRTVVGFL